MMSPSLMLSFIRLVPWNGAATAMIRPKRRISSLWARCRRATIARWCGSWSVLLPPAPRPIQTGGAKRTEHTRYTKKASHTLAFFIFLDSAPTTGILLVTFPFVPGTPWKNSRGWKMPAAGRFLQFCRWYTASGGRLYGFFLHSASSWGCPQNTGYTNGRNDICSYAGCPQYFASLPADR